MKIEEIEKKERKTSYINFKPQNWILEFSEINTINNFWDRQEFCY